MHYNKDYIGISLMKILSLVASYYCTEQLLMEMREEEYVNKPILLTDYDRLIDILEREPYKCKARAIYNMFVNGDLLFIDDSTRSKCVDLITCFFQKVTGGTIYLILLSIEVPWTVNNMGTACNHYCCQYYDCGGRLDFSQVKVKIHEDYARGLDVYNINVSNQLGCKEGYYEGPSIRERYDLKYVIYRIVYR